MNEIKIVGIVVDKTQLIMYLADGSINTSIKQGDPRLQEIVAKAVPEINMNGFSIISLDAIKEQNHYEEFEKKSSIVKFFKVAKAKLKELFAPSVPELEVGTTVISEDTKEKTIEKVSQTLEAVQDVIKNATPVSHATYHSKDVHRQGDIRENDGRTNNSTADSVESHTVIAVVQTETGPKVIPSMERIESQFKHSNVSGNPVGMENFLKRLGAVIEKRQHSVEDLLKFIERNDMPLADDGCFIAYKVLNRRGEGYVDVHSGNVTQWLGSYVHMDENMVDPNRRNECSNGLHIARRGYVGGFSGSACVLAKVAPEDVIAVPTYDANKIRVCGYHIVDELTDEEYGYVKRNEPITNAKAGGVKLAKVIAGQHVGRRAAVKIGGQRGTNLKITHLKEEKIEVSKEPVKAVQALPDKSTENIKSPQIDPKEILKVHKEVIEKVQSKKEKAKELYDQVQKGSQEAYNELVALKKASKVGWDKLGIKEPVEPKKAIPAPVAPKHKAEPKGKEEPVKKETKPERSVMGNLQQQMEELKKLTLDYETANEMLNLKRSSKKSWEYFGISKDRAELIILKAK